MWYKSERIETEIKSFNADRTKIGLKFMSTSMNTIGQWQRSIEFLWFLYVCASLRIITVSFHSLWIVRKNRYIIYTYVYKNSVHYRCHDSMKNVRETYLWCRKIIYLIKLVLYYISLYFTHMHTHTRAPAHHNMYDPQNFCFTNTSRSYWELA